MIQRQSCVIIWRVRLGLASAKGALDTYAKILSVNILSYGSSHTSTDQLIRATCSMIYPAFIICLKWPIAQFQQLLHELPNPIFTRCYPLGMVGSINIKKDYKIYYSMQWLFLLHMLFSCQCAWGWWIVRLTEGSACCTLPFRNE